MKVITIVTQNEVRKEKPHLEWLKCKRWPQKCKFCPATSGILKVFAPTSVQVNIIYNGDGDLIGKILGAEAL